MSRRGDGSAIDCIPGDVVVTWLTGKLTRHEVVERIEDKRLGSGVRFRIRPRPRHSAWGQFDSGWFSLEPAQVGEGI